MREKARKKIIKWTLLIILGCLAYFAGNYLGQKKLIAEFQQARLLVQSN